MLESFCGNTLATFLAHPDDESLGCGGTLARAIEDGARVHCIIPVKRIEEKCKNALSQLGVKNIYWGEFEDNQMDKYPLIEVCKFLEEKLDYIKPDYLFTHHYNCTNQDHRVCYQATIIACRKRPIDIFSCEIPSATGYLRPCGFEPNFYVALRPHDVTAKLHALEEYGLQQFPHPFSEEYINSLLNLRGSDINVKFAEAFMLVKGRYEKNIY